MKHFLPELVGTFFLVFAIALTGNPLCYGFIYAAVLYLGVHAVGGFCNPAVTLALYLHGKYKQQQFMHILAAQFVGAFAALMLACFVTSRPFVLPADPTSITMPCLSECLLTFLLCAVILSLVAQKLKEVVGLVAGLTLVGIGYMGGVCNPVLSLTSQLLMLGKTGTFDAHSLFIFFVCPLAAGAFAGYVCKHYHN